MEPPSGWSPSADQRANSPGTAEALTGQLWAAWSNRVGENCDEGRQRGGTSQGELQKPFR